MVSKEQQEDLEQALASLDVDSNPFASDNGGGGGGSRKEDALSGGGESSPLVVVDNDDDDDDDTPRSRRTAVVASMLVFAVLAMIVVFRDTIVWLLTTVLIAVLIVLAVRTTLPTRESLDVKVEIQKQKRHKVQTTKKTWFGKTAAGVRNKITTEAKHAVGAYDEVQCLDAGVCMVAITRDLTSQQTKYYSWIGIWHRWYVWNLAPERQASLHEWLWKQQQQPSRPSRTTTRG